MRKRTVLVLIVVFLVTARYGSAQETVKIGVVFAKTGKAAVTNRHYFNAARLARDEINRSGGLLGKKIELLEFDNHSTALNSRSAATQAVNAAVVGVIGASWSSHTMAMAPVMQAAGIPLITPTATSPDITRRGDCIFRVCFNDTFQGRALAGFAAAQLKAGKVVVLTNTDSQYSIGLAKSFIDHFRKHGGQLLWEADYLENVSGLPRMLEKLNSLQPDIIFLPGQMADSARIIIEARKSGIIHPFLGGDGWSSVMLDFADASALEGSFHADHWHQGVSSQRSRRFIKAYANRYGPRMPSGVALTYDAFMLLADAINRAGSVDKKQIRDALAATRHFDGTTGQFSINANGDPLKPILILHISGRQSIPVRTIQPQMMP